MNRLVYNYEINYDKLTVCHVKVLLTSPIFLYIYPMLEVQSLKSDCVTR